MELQKGIHKFDTGPFNWYVLEEAGRLTVVDAGFPGHYGLFVEGLRTIGRTVADVEAIVVTHAHADHMGFAERLRKLTKAPVFVHREDVEAVRHHYPLPWWGLVSHAYHPFMASVLARAVLGGLVLQPGISKGIAVEDGRALDIPGRPVVVHTPGHTPGQIALYLPSSRALISSDAVITRNLITGEAGGPQLAHPSLNSDSNAALSSLQKLRGFGDVLLLPGHGKPWRGQLADALDAIISSDRQKP